MTHTPHELVEEFPAYAHIIHDLKDTDPYFVRLVDTYHTVNREIHRIETRVEPASNEREERLRKVRLTLKDEIADMLARASANAA